MSKALTVTLCKIRSPRTGRARWVTASVGVAAAVLLVLNIPWAVHAQAPGAAGPTPRIAEQGERWSELKPAQQAALKPLEHDWPGLALRSKQKWLELSTRFAELTPAQQARVQERMADWTKLTPSQRGEARLSYQEAKQLPAQDRQARWKTYEAMSPEQKQQLAAKAASTNDAARKGNVSGKRNDSKPEKASREVVSQAKSNIVPNPAFAATPRVVGPTVVQARPGATTTLITKRPTPPRHQQTGLPKISGTSEFVNETTLLPQRGPQGAAARAAAVPAAALAPASK